MIVENVPVYGAGANGLSASYSVNFALDLNHIIPLNGMFQGDPVLAKSLYINNYNNAFAITVSAGNYSVVCPAYSSGYVDIRGFTNVTLTAESSANTTVQMNVMNFQNPAGFQTRSFQPSSLTNDPNFSKVTALYHFDGIDNSKTVYNSKTAAFTTLQYSDEILGNKYHGFKSSAGSTRTLLPQTGGSSGGEPYTIEFKFTIKDFFLNAYNVIFEENTGTQYLENKIVALVANGSGLVRMAFGYYNNNNTTLTIVGEIAYNFALNTEYNFALVGLSSTSHYAYINGSVIGSINNTLTLTSSNPMPYIFGAENAQTVTATGGILSGGGVGMYNPEIFVDEFRYTNMARYLSPTYTVATAPFLDQ